MSARVCLDRVSAVLARAPTRCEHWLSGSELTRAARLRVVPRHQHYLAGHWLLREALAAPLGCAATAIELIDIQNQPPCVAGSSLSLSLAHSGDWVACAWSEQPIGIDLEQRQPRPALLGMARWLLAVDEHVADVDDDALLQRWVVKECLIKRDRGAALPEQLAAMRIARSQARADVLLLSSSEFHLGIASGVVPSLPTGAGTWACSHWRVLGANG
jgi:4'-phosphopantetheinyl transferase